MEFKSEAILLLHGALADARMWEEHIPLLNIPEYSILTMTQRHFGKGGMADSGSFGIKTHAKDLAGFIRSENISHIHIVAWSYGADVALNTLAEYPDIVASVFLYEPGYPGFLTPAEMESFVEDAGSMFGPVFDLVSQGDLERATEVLIDGSGNKIGYFASQSKTLRKQQIENAHSLPKQLNQKEQPGLSAERLSKIIAPVTIAYGCDTRKLFKVVARAAAKLIPHAKELCVESSSHMLPMENPALFMQLVGEHLKELSPRTSDAVPFTSPQ